MDEIIVPLIIHSLSQLVSDHPLHHTLHDCCHNQVIDRLVEFIQEDIDPLPDLLRQENLDIDPLRQENSQDDVTENYYGLSSENTSWSSSTDSSSSDSPNQMCKQISFSSPRRTKRCIWNDEMDTCLLLYLELNKDKMEKLHNPHSGVKSELWNGASKWMLADGHDLSPKQCFNRWKNIKQCYKCGKLNEVKDPVQYNSVKKLLNENKM
ncbi:unnamed protein product [Rhizophagus irregularis]|nr:unnamed protein product [Rhizophagus irregularis]